MPIRIKTFSKGFTMNLHGMTWHYLNWDEKTGYITDDNGKIQFFSENREPIKFDSWELANQYLIDNDIRADLR